MRFYSVISTLALGLGVTLTVSGQRRCGSQLSVERITEAEAHFQANKVEPSTLEVESKSGGKTVLNVYWHVITAGKSLKEGNVPDKQIKANIAQTNKDYSKTGIQIKLVKIDRTFNKLWFNNATQETPEQDAMKKALRKGGPADINVYTVRLEAEPAPHLLGYATFPMDYANNPQNDGIVIKYSTLPGGTEAPYNQGKTFTHELGHWLGLYHPFEGESCSGPGDYVDDTPQEKSSASGCDYGRDTCPDQPGKDPIHNFMDYSDDVCLTEFTKGQIKRIKYKIRTYRGVNC
ncbi:extracellular metalloprotease [Ceratobasidium sp. AG-Ba]|nr:extracellular metalloprotease [Ceratobasidium sp. AG-Ba]